MSKGRRHLQRAIFWSLLIVANAIRGFTELAAQPVTCVIHISVDGLRPDAVTALGPSNAPNFFRLRREGAFTDNARADSDYTLTLPDHACELTGRSVLGSAGHNWTNNVDTGDDQTLALNKGSYVASVFDVAHDHGLRTAFFASKLKFSLFLRSWDGTHGAPDLTPPDNGKNKIDAFNLFSDTTVLVSNLVVSLAAQPYNYVFLHLADPDGVGHPYGWDITPGSPYSEAVELVDKHLGTLLEAIESNAFLNNHTVLILTSDHGGLGMTHADPTLPPDYTVPFYVWGLNVTPDVNLYDINPLTRQNPGSSHLDYSQSPQPIRNGDAANLALKLLGLGPVPGSNINSNQNLAVTFKEDFRLTLNGSNPIFSFTTITNSVYDILNATSLSSGSWSVVASNLPGNGNRVTNLLTRSPGVSQEFFRLQRHF